MDSPTMLGIIFLVIGAIVALSEIHTLTIYLLAIAVGLFAAGGLALAGGSLTGSLALLAAIIILGMPVAHWLRGKMKNHESEAISHDDAGHTVTVIGVEGTKLRVGYRGSIWNARLEAAAAAVPAVGDICTIARREGSVLILAPCQAQSTVNDFSRGNAP